ncbi:MULTISPECIES: hypothetical protein [Mycobacteriaceae]|uniref:Secreted protein n=1 Tax=Mycolicibacterium mucogenicum DSM 44124 TaxID=1226753 RepID=A0A8H2PIX6_MYCMU|nr:MULTISPECIES: hypothetical protein [Mycobacteriaceae]KAB7752358.1 hypothetical protein MMUC44124_27655 [Mycolicibacterium mucogenicum DSM 44124]QPG68692.1 hypothetical protein C1S78_025195 [Mycolicibacterium mucogenicum DSM 44124]SEB23855.1 hypothetical protein SAMN04488580_11378 [Mycobacterium sp. 283mftsu]
MKLPLFVLAGASIALTAPSAHAAPPPNFPDFTGFNVVTNTHLTTYQRTDQQMVKFSTPDGLACLLSTLSGTGPVVRCYGPVPGMAGLGVTVDPTAKAPRDFGVAQLHAANAGTVSNYRGDVPADLAGAPLLAPGEKVTLATTTCGVVAGGVTACIDTTDGGHGFVLQPSGSWTF